MTTNLVAAIAVSFYTNVYEHHWGPTLKTTVSEVGRRTTWTFPPHLGIPDSVRDDGSVSQTTMLLSLQHGQWVELSSGRTSGIFVTTISGWMFYVPIPHACPQFPPPMPCPPCPPQLNPGITNNALPFPIPPR